eukprot:3825520-Amphidinium_carterae.1
MKGNEHPAYIFVDEETLRTKAQNLPENGVPPEIITVIAELDDEEEKLQQQKAATPLDGMQQEPAAAGTAFALERPRA